MSLMTSELLPWQQENWRQLREYVKQGRVPQALLISGRPGISKSGMARKYAYSLLCARPDEQGFPCGKCRYCALASAGNHPDFLEITPEDDKKSISIGQIRSVIADTSLMPQYEAYRVILIHPAELLTISACNGFLKCLEEPSERTVFILLTEKPGKLPATIRSRCQKLQALAPSGSMLSNWLYDQKVTDERTRLVGLFTSSIVQYQQFLDNTVFALRKDCFHDWQALAFKEKYPALVAEKWDKLPKSDLLNWMLSWVVDIIKHKHQIGSNFIYNQDVIKPLQKLSLQLDLSALYDLYDKVLASRQQIDMQLNFQNTLEDLLVQWQEINRMNSYG